MKLYLAVTRLGGDKDYFPVAQDGQELQFFTSKPRATREAKEALKGIGGEYKILDVSSLVVDAPKRAEWNRAAVTRSPLGRKLSVKVFSGKNEFETIAWRVGRDEWKWEDTSGKITKVPSSFSIREWKKL